MRSPLKRRGKQCFGLTIELFQVEREGWAMKGKEVARGSADVGPDRFWIPMTLIPLGMMAGLVVLFVVWAFMGRS